MAFYDLRFPLPVVIRRGLHDIDAAHGLFEHHQCDAPEYVYFMGAASDHIKIGRSSSPYQRLASIRTSNPGDIRILALIEGGRAIERNLHGYFGDDRIGSSEWFMRSRRLCDLIATAQAERARQLGITLTKAKTSSPLGRMVELA